MPTAPSFASRYRVFDRCRNCAVAAYHRSTRDVQRVVDGLPAAVNSPRGRLAAQSWSLPRVEAKAGVLNLERVNRAARTEVMKGRGFLRWLTFAGAMTAASVQAQDARPTPSDRAAPRADANSQLAHAQLLEKAKQGGIDLYFLGDSIVRRWGATDYPAFLANWKSNFFGWNAANLGWGADQVQNILWRVENGELNGVNPKVIVILAGTNNVGPRAADDAKVADVTRGLRALVDLCREKAPAATIVLTAIFPRNDNLAAMPGINRINENLARFADGKSIRFVNINAQLADTEGKLFDGMMGDKLHPTLKGYQIWADALKPLFTELLGPPAPTDHAPPPTGDPSAAAKSLSLPPKP